MIPFFILYGITGIVAFIAAVYLLLRRGNAFAPDVTPPVQLRRWAASFFSLLSLSHVWWYFFYIYSGDTHSVVYLVNVVLDCAGMLTTIAGTLLSMLQDRKRPVWPAFAAMIPVIALGVFHICYPDGPFMDIATVYILSFYVLFSGYIAFSVRKYGQWLNDNYADLENKKVWLSQMVSLVCLLMFIFYVLVDSQNILIYLLHFIQLLLIGLLLWRVETLPLLEEPPVQESTSLHTKEEQEGGSEGYFANIDLAKIERLLAKHCVGTQLYLQHELTLQQLAQAIGTNRSYLSQYFARQGITYNTYINNLRINYFISSYQEIVRTHQPFTVQQLVSDSGYRSYSTFSRAFMQRMGQSVTAWMRQSAE